MTIAPITSYALSVDEQGQTPLHIAVNNNDFYASMGLIAQMSIEDICLQNNEGYTALHSAAQQGFIPLTYLLLNKGGATLANQVDKYNQTALHWAIARNDLITAIALIEKMSKEALFLKDQATEYTVLHLAAQNSNPSLINMLLNKGGPELAKVVDKHGQTALHWAATRCFVSCYLLCNQMEAKDIFKTNANNQSALDFAIQNNYHDIIRLLMSKASQNTSIDLNSPEGGDVLELLKKLNIITIIPQQPSPYKTEE